MAGKSLLSAILVAVAFLVSAPKAFAVVPPTFPVCSNPQGTLKTSYDSGTHGVPGNSSNFTGKDSVYTLSGDTLLQCLCADNGQGVQTNWWKVSSLTTDEIAVLISQGWTQVPDGSAWGLDSAPYLAKNINYSCSSGGTGGPEVLGASTGDVLGLATTGNSLFILSVILAGVAFIGTGILLNRIKK